MSQNIKDKVALSDKPTQKTKIMTTDDFKNVKDLALKILNEADLDFETVDY
jgi:hypothetical protein